MRDASPAGGSRVVLIEDEDDFRSLVRLLLGGDPRFEIVGEASTADAALELVETTGPDVVLTDLVIGSSRLDLIPLLQQTSAAPVVVVMSAHSRVTMEERVLDAGAAAYLEKFDIHGVGDVLAHALGSSGG